MTLSAKRVAVLLQIVVLAFLTLHQLLSLPQQTSHDKLSDAPLLDCRGTETQPPLLPVARMENGFGGCLIIQDDNHLLAEWLAYHYHRLPLRRLVVAIDPRSETSPTEIFDRFRNKGLMKITEWGDQDFMPPHLVSSHRSLNASDHEAITSLYVERQIQFYTKCMAILRLEGISWTAMIDTDEYVLPNPMADERNRLKGDNWTLFQMLDNKKNQLIHPMIRRGCISMHRLQFGNKESNRSSVQDQVPKGFDGYDFTTMRWRYHAARTDKASNKVAKCLINLKEARDADFHSPEVDPHRPIKRLCSILNLRIPNSEAPVIAYHYSGSWEQWNFRNDSRPKRRRDSFDKLHFTDEKLQDDAVRPWLGQFVNENGYTLARYLLSDAGQLHKRGQN